MGGDLLDLATTSREILSFLILGDAFTDELTVQLHSIEQLKSSEHYDSADEPIRNIVDELDWFFGEFLDPLNTKVDDARIAKIDAILNKVNKISDQH